MPAKCCVPGCKSNYDTTSEYVSVFKFPSDAELREKWLNCIPRKDWTPSKSSVVCVKHFLLSDIIISDKFTDKSGVEHELPRKNPALKKTVYPAVFSDLLNGVGLDTYRIPRWTVSTNVKNKDVIIIKSANVAKRVKSTTKQRSETLEQVEQLLLIWIKAIQSAGDSLSESMIHEKAKLIHADLLKNTTGTSQEEREVFKASLYWFDNFKKRNWTDIHSVGASRGDGASGDTDATNDFVTETGDFETDLTLKKMPNITNISEEVASPSSSSQELPEPTILPVTNVAECHAPGDESSHIEEQDIMTWTKGEITMWLTKYSLENSSLLYLSGEEIIFLHKLRYEAPQFFNYYLESKLQLESLLDLSRASDAFADLTW